MKSIILLLLFLILLLFSCKKSTDKVVYVPPVFHEVIPKTVAVFGDTIDALTYTPVIVDSFLILGHESMRNEQLFHVYNRFTGKYVLSFGDKGRGYGELVSITSISMDYNTKSMYVGAMNQSRAAIFALDSLGYGKVGVSEIRLKQPLSSTGFFRLKPDNYLTIYNPYNRFALYDKELNVADTCNYYSPTITGITDGYALTNYYFYSSGVEVKPDGTRFANITYCGAILEIFDIKQNKIEHLTTNYFYQPTYDNKSGDPLWKECILGTRDQFSTDKYIYILFNGTMDDDTRIDKISVFNWEGKPVKQYDLGVDIMRIGVNEEAGKGYIVLRDDSLEYRLGYFDL